MDSIKSSNTYIDIFKFEKQKEIKSDGQTETYIIRDKDTKNIFFAKASHDEVTKFTPIPNLAIDQESNLLSKIKHPSIIKFVGFSQIDLERKNKHVMITEYCKNGSLNLILKKQQISINDTHKLIILFGIASGMLYLKSNKIIFRNLNTKNILLDDNLFPKICGFQLAKQYDSTPYIIADIEGEPIYIAPEIWENWKYSEASDVYAFSMIAYQLMTDQTPFQNLNEKEISEKVKENLRPDINSINIPESYKNLIQNCWSQNPEKRPSFDQIVDLLKTDENFITKNINKEEYLQYVHFIENKDIKQLSAKEEKDKNIEDFNQLSATFRKAKKIEVFRQNSAKKDKDLNDEEEFIIDIDKASFEAVKYNIQLEQIRIKIAISTTCHQFLEIVKNKFKLDNVSFYLTFNNHLSEVHVLDDDNPIYNLNTHNFIVHNGEVIHSTKTYIESLINARIINFGDDFSLQTNSLNANYDVEFPPDHDGWLDVPFNITNNSPTSSTDKALISLKMNEKETSLLQKGNTILHQYYKDGEWITEDEPVFLSYPDCKTAIFLLNHCSGHRVTTLDTTIRKLIPDEYKDDKYSCDWNEMCPHTFFNKGNKDYYLPVDYKSIGIKVNSFDENTCVAFHATKARFVSSIIKNGFILPSKRDGVLPGHIPLDIEVFGIDNFADAIFASPSIKYSSKYGKQPIDSKGNEITYIESGHIEDGLIRILILQVRVKPNSFSIHRNTTPDHKFKDPHFDNDELEWRIGNPKDIFPYRLLFRYYSNLDEFNSDIHSYGQDFQESNSIDNYSKIFNFLPKIKSENDHDLVIGIGYRMTEILFNNNKLNSKEFTDIIDCFSGFIIEIKYPSKQFENIYDLILNLKKSYESKIKIRIYICGIKSTGQIFSNNNSISYMKLNSNVAEIQCDSQSFGDGSFTECNSLEDITIPSSVASIGNCSFFKCFSLTNIIIPSSVTSIGDYAFCGCLSLTQISIPSSVISIGDCAFFGCYSLKQIDIPSSVTSVGKAAFFGCFGLTHITIPSSINRDYLRIPPNTKIIII